MDRKDFLKLLTLSPTLLMGNDLKALNKLSQTLPTGDLMPALFIGHGSPINGIETNRFTGQWEQLGNDIPRPAAVLVISAHWLTRGTAVTAMTNPKTIYDFGGFPPELYQVKYPAPGSPEIAKEVTAAVKSTDVSHDHEWGLDHGTWTVVRHMYPDADIPVLQLSIDYHQSPQYHYDLGRELSAMRKKGVLIIGSGNMVHNLGKVAWGKMKEPEYGFDWALEMNAKFKELILSKSHNQLIDYPALGPAARLAIPTPDHYYPLLYVLGLQETRDSISFFNDVAIAGSLTMTGVKLG